MGQSDIERLSTNTIIIFSIKMKGYIVLLCFFTVLLVELTKAQNAKAVLEKYKENRNSVSRPALAKAFQEVCCGKSTGGLRRQKRAGPICRWIRRVKPEISCIIDSLGGR